MFIINSVLLKPIHKLLYFNKLMYFIFFSEVLYLLFQNIWQEKTNLFTKSPLPGILCWFPVVHTDVVSVID